MGKRQSIEDLLNQLKIHSKSDDHELVLDCANNILHQSPNDKNAIHSKIVALIKLDQFNEGLKFINENHELTEKYPLEYAYILYKTENFNQLFDKFDGFNGESKGITRAILHILAQAKYRQEDLTKAEEFYKKIDQTSTPYNITNEESDISVNRSAVSALKAILKKESSSAISASNIPSSTKDLSYDHLFNIATENIGLGNYSAALDLLREAQMTCKDSPYLQTPQDLADEIAPILVQAAYVNNILGNKTESLAILEESVNIQGLSPGLVKLISVNNLLALKDEDEDIKIDNDDTVDSTTNPAEALSNSINSVKSAIKSLVELDNSSGNPTELNLRINTLQNSLVSRNKLILQIRSGRDITSSANHFVYNNPTKVGVKSLSVLSKINDGEQDINQETHKSTIKKLRQLLTQSSSPLTLPIFLTLAQIYINNNNLDSAAEALETIFKQGLNDITNKTPYLPGLIGSLVSVYTLQNRTKAAVDLIAESFKTWSSSTSQKDLSIPASILAESDVPEYRSLAFEYFKSDLSLNPNSFSSAAGLLSTGHPEAVENYDSVSSKASLTPISNLTSNINADTLNEAGVAHLILKRAATSSLPDSSNKRRKTTTTTKRRSKLPKDYDPSKQPDPERWLPKRDRTTWKPKRKDKRNAAKSTQGGAVDNTTESGIQQQATSVVQSKPSSAVSKNKKKKKAKR